MAQIICPKCKKQIDDKSEFCTFCGSKIDSTPLAKSTKKEASTIKKPKVILLSLSILLLLSFVSIAILSYYTINISSKYNDISRKYQGVSTELATKDKDLEKLKKDLEKVEKSYSTLKKDNATLKKHYQEEQQLTNDLYTSLFTSETTNGFISLSSKVFSVRKGSTDKIFVNWKQNATVYMWVDGSNISAEWSGDNILVKGIESGVSSIKFSTDKAGKSNTFSVTVICYE